LRVVIVNNFAHQTGGADQHCFWLAEALRRRGHEVAFLATADDRNTEQEGVFIPCTVTHASRDHLSLVRQAGVFAGALWNRSAGRAMRQLLDEFRPDVVHAHKLYPQLSVAPVVVASRAGFPVVQTLHDFEMISSSPIDARGGWWDRDEAKIRYQALNSATRPVHRFVHAPRVDAFVSVSRFVARVHAPYGIEATVLPNFVPAVRSVESLSGYEGRRGIAFLGRLRPEKGVLDVVEMAKYVDGIDVTIVGSGDLEETVRSASESTPNLHAAGFVSAPTLQEIIEHSRVLVIPSRCQDAGPLVPLESMSHGTPVVAYSVGGLGEYVADAGGGRVIPSDVQAMAAAATEIHEDRATWERLSGRGLAAIAERHTPDVYAERIEEIYRSVMTSRKAA
jgi:glycosyltransferase involved in cell wall biosynthesis